MGALHPDANPYYGGGRISGKNNGVMREKINGRPKRKQRGNRGRKRGEIGTTLEYKYAAE